MNPEHIIGAKFICLSCAFEFWHWWTSGNMDIVAYYGGGSNSNCKSCDHFYVKNLYFRPKYGIIRRILRKIKVLLKGYKKMTSTAINNMDYQFIDGKPRLDIEFHSGGKYRYFDVPLSVFNGLANADSRGKFFQKEIRNEFKFEKLP